MSQKNLGPSVFDGGAKDTGQRDVARVAEHTPGPWRVFTTPDGREVIGIGETNGDGIADCGFGLWRFGSDECHANARLIAASPEMYAQLDDALITLGEVAKVLARDYPSLANNVVNQCAIRCADVLAKARGEQ